VVQTGSWHIAEISARITLASRGRKTKRTKNVYRCKFFR